MQNTSVLRAAQHAAGYWKEDGSDLCFVSDCQLVVDSWERGRQFCCTAQDWFADLWRQVVAILNSKFGSRWRVQKVAAHQSRVEVDSGRLSRHEWLDNSKLMKWLAAARLGMRWPQVMSTPKALYICSSGEWSPDAEGAEDVEIRDVAPVARARLQVTFGS